MNKTYTPELTPDVLDRLRDFARPFQGLFHHKAQAVWSGVYLRGLLQDGERKSIEPMVARVPLPAELLHIQDAEQALQQFVNQSPWEDQRVFSRFRAVMAPTCASPKGLFVIDDTSFPKQGTHSVETRVNYDYRVTAGEIAARPAAPTGRFVTQRPEMWFAISKSEPARCWSNSGRLSPPGFSLPIPAGELRLEA